MILPPFSAARRRCPQGRVHLCRGSGL